MNRRFFSVFNFTLFAGLFVLLSSCSGLLRDTGSATFSISPEVLKTAIENATIERINQNSLILANEDDLNQEKGNYPEEDFFDSEKIELKVSLLGKYQKTITNIYTMEEMDALTGGSDNSKTATPIIITFPDIPLGNSVTAEASISFIFTSGEKQTKQMYYKGTSESKKIVAGNNPLDVVLKECHPFLIKIYVEDETAANSDVPGFRYDYYQEGTFNNYENFDEDFYNHIMEIKETESERYKDYEYDDFESSFDENGTEVFKVFFKKKVSAPVMIYYEVYPYYQSKNTTYDDEKTLAEQADIFTQSTKMAGGEVAEDKWEGDLKNVIVPKASLNVSEGYEYCGYAVEQNGDDEYSYIIKIYFKSTKTQEPVEDTATLNIYCSVSYSNTELKPIDDKTTSSIGSILMNDGIIQEMQEEEYNYEQNDDDYENDDDYSDAEDAQYTLKVTLTGSDSYSETIEKEISAYELYSNSALVTFEKVPVGTIRANAVIYAYYLEEKETEYSAITIPFAKAVYEWEIPAGVKNVQMVLDTYTQEVTSYILNYYFEDKEATDSEYPGYALNESYEQEGACTSMQDLYMKLAEVMKTTEGYTYNPNRIVYKLDTDGLCNYVLFFDEVVEEPEPEPATATFTITLESAAVEEVPEDLVIDENIKTSVIYTAEGYASYEWFIDGEKVTANDSVEVYECAIDTAVLAAGVHYISVTVVDSNGSRWSSGIYKLIVQK